MITTKEAIKIVKSFGERANKEADFWERGLYSTEEFKEKLIKLRDQYYAANSYLHNKSRDK